MWTTAWKAVRGNQSVEFDSRALRHERHITMFIQGRMFFVWMFSGFLTLTRQDHRPFQEALAEQIVQKFYLENARVLATLPKDEYELAEKIIGNFAKVILDAPTFYESFRNCINHARSISAEYKKIMKKDK